MLTPGLCHAPLEVLNESVEGRDFLFDANDRMRAELLAEGVELQDSPQGTTWTAAARP